MKPDIKISTVLIFPRQKSCPKNKSVILADKEVVVPRMNTTV